MHLHERAVASLFYRTVLLKMEMFEEEFFYIMLDRGQLIKLYQQECSQQVKGGYCPPFIPDVALVRPHLEHLIQFWVL